MIKRIKSKLSIKIFIITALLMILCCVVTYLFIEWFMPITYTSNITQMEDLASEYAQELQGYAKENASDFFGVSDQILQDKYGDAFTIHLFGKDGREVSISTLSPIGNKSMEDYADIPTTTPFQFTTSDSNESYTIFFANNSSTVNQALEALNKTFPFLLVAVLLLSFAGAAIYSWYIASPIVKISRVSRLISELDFGARCAENRTDEIGVLSHSLNEMSDKLSAALAELQQANEKLQSDIERERALEQQRTAFFSAASHELKTPITIIKGQLQGMLAKVGRYRDRDAYLAQSIEVADTLEKMVGELLTVSRLETPGYACIKEDFNLSDLVNEQLNIYEDLFTQKGLSLEKSVAGNMLLRGDAGLLRKVVDNVLGNALSYSPAGNAVRVMLGKEEGHVLFSVENTGASIPEQDLPKLFEAFYRVEQSRSRKTGGSGLGLYIVKTISDLHGAECIIENTERGVKLAIRF